MALDSTDPFTALDAAVVIHGSGRGNVRIDPILKEGSPYTHTLSITSVAPDANGVEVARQQRVHVKIPDEYLNPNGGVDEAKIEGVMRELVDAAQRAFEDAAGNLNLEERADPDTLAPTRPNGILAEAAQQDSISEALTRMGFEDRDIEPGWAQIHDAFPKKEALVFNPNDPDPAANPNLRIPGLH